MRTAAVSVGRTVSWAMQATGGDMSVRIVDEEQRFVMIGKDQGEVEVPHSGTYTISFTAGTETITKTIVI
jgi:hypothetical protein